MNTAKISKLYSLGSISEFEFLDLLNKRWVSLDRKIRICSSKDISWNDFQLLKAEKHEIDLILEKLEN